MTVTREHAQMLTTLAIACRPHRAPTLDAEGWMAHLRKVAHLDLAEVGHAALRLTKDVTATTPAAIANPASQYYREQLKPEKWEPTIIDPADRCSVCSKDRGDCETRRVDQRGMDPNDPRYDDHSFASDFKTKRGPDVIEIVDALKAERLPMREPKHADDRPTEESASE